MDVNHKIAKPVFILTTLIFQHAALQLNYDGDIYIFLNFYYGRPSNAPPVSPYQAKGKI